MSLLTDIYVLPRTEQVAFTLAMLELAMREWPSTVTVTASTSLDKAWAILRGIATDAEADLNTILDDEDAGTLFESANTTATGTSYRDLRDLFYEVFVAVGYDVFGEDHMIAAHDDVAVPHVDAVYYVKDNITKPPHPTGAPLTETDLSNLLSNLTTNYASGTWNRADVQTEITALTI